MEVSGQLHDPAALPPGKEPPVPIGKEAGWAPEPTVLKSFVLIKMKFTVKLLQSHHTNIHRKFMLMDGQTLMHIRNYRRGRPGDQFHVLSKAREYH
jgi:hypothetical protein